MKKILKIINSVNEWAGKGAQWFALALILIGVTEVVMRYVFDRPTMWGYEILVMTGAAMYALSWGHVHLHQGHVRMDVLYRSFSTKGKSIVDAIFFLLFFVPVVGLLAYTSASWMWHAWEINEKSVLTYWYPPIAPLRTVVFIGVCLLALQGIARLIADLHSLKGTKVYD